MLYKVPIDIYIDSTNPARAEKELRDFMRDAIREFGPSYRVVEYEEPVGYPTEPYDPPSM